MQPLAWEVARALTKLGIAMAANRPMMATTIMISTSVKPVFRRMFIFILLIAVGGVNNASGSISLHYESVYLIAWCYRWKENSNSDAKIKDLKKRAGFDFRFAIENKKPKAFTLGCKRS